MSPPPIPVPRTWRITMELRRAPEPPVVLSDPEVYAHGISDVMDASSLGPQLDRLSSQMPEESATGLTLTVELIR